MVMITGITESPLSLVPSLNLLQKSMRFNPWGPRAVPTGGAGLALPAGICSFIVVLIFLAILYYSLIHGFRRLLCDYIFFACKKSNSTGVSLPKIEINTLIFPLDSS